jgi:hypothetical protein
VSLDPLVSTDDFASAFPRDLTDTEAGRLDYLLGSASGQVRAFCRRDFTATSSTIRVKPLGDKVTLPNPPITGITSVKRVNFDGTTTAFVGWMWDGGVTLYGMGCIGSPMINAPEAWFDDYYTPLVEVTYTHGDADIPPVVTDVVIAMVARVLNQPDPANALDGTTGISETRGPFSRNLNFAGNPSAGVVPRLSASDKQTLRDAGFGANAAYTVQLG